VSTHYNIFLTPCQYFKIYFYIVIIIIIQNNMLSQAHSNNFLASWEGDKNNGYEI